MRAVVIFALILVVLVPFASFTAELIPLLVWGPALALLVMAGRLVIVTIRGDIAARRRWLWAGTGGISGVTLAVGVNVLLFALFWYSSDQTQRELGGPAYVLFWTIPLVPVLFAIGAWFGWQRAKNAVGRIS